MGNDRYRTVSGLFFALIALLQAIRALMQLPIQVGATSIPVWLSWVAVAVTGALATWAFRGR